MERGPRRRIVQGVLSECLSRIQVHGERGEAEFAPAVADLPALLRQAAAHLEEPPEEIAGHPECPGTSGYSAWAQTYDQESDNPVVAAEESAIWEVIGDPAGLRVLDVGCGTGRHAVRLAAAGARVTAMDPTPEMLARARENARARGVAVDLRLGAVADLDDDAGEFDLVLCCLVLSHVADLAGAVARLARRVAPGGRLVVSDFHPCNLQVGFRTSFRSDGRKYVVPNHLHLTGGYFTAMAGAGLVVTRMLEPGRSQKLPHIPLALVMEGRRSAG